MTRRTATLLTTLIVLLLSSAYQSLALPVAHSTLDTAVPTSTLAVVRRVVDGDTIELESGEKVRYIGVNTPESVDPRRPVECFGKEASEYNRRLVEGKKVSLGTDVGDKDKYGRLLRYVYLEDGTFINLKLVEDGYANVMTVPPNVAKQNEFIQTERAARTAQRGLWKMCK